MPFDKRVIMVHDVPEFGGARSARLKYVQLLRRARCVYAHAKRPYSYTNGHLLQLQRSELVLEGNGDHG